MSVPRPRPVRFSCRRFPLPSRRSWALAAERALALASTLSLAACGGGDVDGDGDVDAAPDFDSSALAARAGATRRAASSIVASPGPETLATAQARAATLEARVAALEARLDALNEHLRVQNVRGLPTVRVVGANLQIVNGTGKTASRNGVGNLIVGYNERRGSGDAATCSQATLAPPNARGLKYTVSDRVGCDAAGNTWALNHLGGSHNLVVGPRHNYSAYGGAVIGLQNAIGYEYASVSGGQYNVSAGTSSNVTGGNANQAYSWASVAGGSDNVADGDFSVVSGGVGNLAGGNYAAVAGGGGNSASELAASVGGGRENRATAMYSSVSGGYGADATLNYQWRGGFRYTD